MLLIRAGVTAAATSAGRRAKNADSLRCCSSEALQGEFFRLEETAPKRNVASAGEFLCVVAAARVACRLQQCSCSLQAIRHDGEQVVLHHTNTQ